MNAIAPIQAALRYAQHGVVDYRVVDVGAAVTYLLSEPGQNGYRA